jgi:predicted HD phosphohydrolase
MNDTHLPKRVSTTPRAPLVREILAPPAGLLLDSRQRLFRGCHATPQTRGREARVSVADEIFAIYSARGSAAYFGEPVSVTEHGLQAAHFAQLEQAPPQLVIAALLHDIGHLVVECPDDIEEWTSDAHHERVGSGWLAKRFGPEVSEPVRLHVPAKRYLCATRAAYLKKLSPASVVTLKLQGDPGAGMGRSGQDRGVEDGGPAGVSGTARGRRPARLVIRGRCARHCRFYW